MRLTVAGTEPWFNESFLRNCNTLRVDIHSAIHRIELLLLIKILGKTYKSYILYVAQGSAAALGRFSPTLTPIYPPYFQNRMHWNRVVYWGEDDWSGSPRSYFARHTSAQLSASTMAVNPNFFPNGYQDPMHPEEEVVTNWVRATITNNTRTS